MKIFNCDTIYFIVKNITSVIFIWSGMTKLLDPEAFMVTIDAFGIVPEIFIQPVTYILPVFEIVLSFLLFFKIRGSLIATISLMILFIVLLAYGIHIGLDIDCGCFGPEDPEKRAFSGLKTALYRDIAIICGLFFMFYYKIKKKSKNKSSL